VAPLYGRLKGEPHRKEVTGRGFYGVESRLETWDGAIKTELDRDGTYRVFVGEKYSPDNLIATGNVSAGWRSGRARAGDYRGHLRSRRDGKRASTWRTRRRTGG
jgi:hypothetical protein